ncbi:MAG: DNA starvation/stationary phase protection protein [Propionibacteriaceae bacterium]
MTDTVERKTTRSTKKGATDPAFQASEKLADSLQKVHVDLIELHLQGKQAHWNVVGKNFRDTHLILDEIIEAARGFSDEIAERMRAIYITPDGRSSTVAKTTSLEEYPEGEVDTAETIDIVADRLYTTVTTMRGVHDDVDEEDPTTADLLHAMIIKLEQYAWMVSAENRIANRSTPTPIHE